MSDRDPYEFWGLKADHPVDEDGQPQDAVIGDYHILFTTMQHPDSGREERPDYQVHDEQHRCVAHIHNYQEAKILCAVLSALDRGFTIGMGQDWKDAGI